ncbi:hypothetical protein CDAR_93791 [Caerostris darwini]|uniref:Uncharacterized protein n=1 Tax=Caerostris darwini TaxID=1538125 RepID=A0AAV4NML4_9ARAC|nr:hypothetical protein CDAR_93791 [Caerostris darwini]
MHRNELRDADLDCGAYFQCHRMHMHLYRFEGTLFRTIAELRRGGSASLLDSFEPALPLMRSRRPAAVNPPNDGLSVEMCPRARRPRLRSNEDLSFPLSDTPPPAIDPKGVQRKWRRMKSFGEENS